MAAIVVFEAGFLKPGDPITNASFALVHFNKTEHKTPCEIYSQTGNDYWIDCTYGTVEVSAPDFRPERVTVSNDPFAPTYEVWLSR